eukprot:5157439-Pleurochrysis_carterae.AAC.4
MSGSAVAICERLGARFTDWSSPVRTTGSDDAGKKEIEVGRISGGLLGRPNGVVFGATCCLKRVRRELACEVGERDERRAEARSDEQGSVLLGACPKSALRESDEVGGVGLAQCDDVRHEP